MIPHWLYLFAMLLVTTGRKRPNFLALLPRWRNSRPNHKASVVPSSVAGFPGFKLESPLCGSSRLNRSASRANNLIQAFLD
jgi:hypothetical protein